MNILSDNHLHSSFSSDSTAPAEAMIRRALELGLSSMCFTEHNDYDYPPEDGKIVFNIDFDNYFDTLSVLREKYRGQIDVRIGIEQGLMASVASRVDAFDPDNRLDFIIGSSHLVNGDDPYYPEFWNNSDVKGTILSYYESIIDNLNTCHNFDVYGHIDYIARYIPAQRTSEYREKDFHDILDHILRTIISKGKGIEINTAGLRYSTAQTNPSPFILKRYHELGGEIITTGSDAHAPEYLAYSFSQVPAILKEAGFRYYTEFRARKPEFKKLDELI